MLGGATAFIYLLLGAASRGTRKREGFKKRKKTFHDVRARVRSPPLSCDKRWGCCLSFFLARSPVSSLRRCVDVLNPMRLAGLILQTREKRCAAIYTLYARGSRRA